MDSKCQRKISPPVSVQRKDSKVRKAVIFFKNFGSKSSMKISHSPCLTPSKIRASLAQVGRNNYCVIPKGEMDGSFQGRRLLKVVSKSCESLVTASTLEGGSVQGSSPKLRDRPSSSRDQGHNDQAALQELPGTPAEWSNGNDMRPMARSELPGPDADLHRLEVSIPELAWSKVELPTPVPSYELALRNSYTRSTRPSLFLNVDHSVLAPPMACLPIQGIQPYDIRSLEHDTICTKDGVAGIASNRRHHPHVPFVTSLFPVGRDPLRDVSRSEDLVSPMSDSNITDLNSPAGKFDKTVSSPSSPRSRRSESIANSTPHSQAPFRRLTIVPSSMGQVSDPVKEDVWDTYLDSLTSEILECTSDLNLSRFKAQTFDQTFEIRDRDVRLTDEDRAAGQTLHEMSSMEDFDIASTLDSIVYPTNLVCSKVEDSEHISAEERAAIYRSTIYRSGAKQPGLQQSDNRTNANKKSSLLCSSDNVHGENVSWPFRDNVAFLDDTAAPTRAYIQEICDMVAVVQNEWIERLDIWPEPKFKTSALPVADIVKRALNVLQRYFQGICENRFEDIFALMHLACALAYIIHKDENSYCWDAFLADMLHWQYGLTSEADRYVFIKVMDQLSSRETLETRFSEARVPFQQLSHPDTLALLGQGRVLKDCVRLLDGKVAPIDPKTIV